MNSHTRNSFWSRVAGSLITPRIPTPLRRRFGEPSPQGQQAIMTLLADDWQADGATDSDPAGETPEQMLANLEARTDRNRRLVIPWLDAARPLEGLRILEVGCGTGGGVVPLAEQGAQVTGVDVRADSLRVAKARLQAQNLSAELVQCNVDDLAAHLPGRSFDMILFWASLEHMTIDERLAAMRETWRLLPTGGLWGVIDTPNRLWCYDAHASQLPFFHWLPAPIATAYAAHSPRPSCQAIADNADPDALDRYGRSVSFHEFTLALAPAETLNVVSSLDAYLRRHNVPRLLRWRFGRARRYQKILRRLCPNLHRAFFEESLQLLIRKP